jgi:hypothetical protein
MAGVCLVAGDFGWLRDIGPVVLEDTHACRDGPSRWHSVVYSSTGENVVGLALTGEDGSGRAGSWRGTYRARFSSFLVAGGDRGRQPTWRYLAAGGSFGAAPAMAAVGGDRLLWRSFAGRGSTCYADTGR